MIPSILQEIEDVERRNKIESPSIFASERDSCTEDTKDDTGKRDSGKVDEGRTGAGAAGTGAAEEVKKSKKNDAAAKVVASLRKQAESMQKTIDSKRNPAMGNQNPTPRRARIISGMAREADRLTAPRAVGDDPMIQYTCICK